MNSSFGRGCRYALEMWVLVVKVIGLSAEFGLLSDIC